MTSAATMLSAAPGRALATLVLLTALTLTSCARAPRPTLAPGAPEYASRLVLALDGIDYRDIVAARERGLFGQFRAPSRLVSTFPSISDVSWHDIFGVLPPRGYQRIYFSHAENAMVGGTLDAITPIEYEERMDLAFGTKLHHLGAYLLSGTVSRREVNVAVERFFDIHGRSTVYVYNVGPDALQHTRGDLDAYFRYLDRRLVELQRDYQQRTGHALEIVVLSDHGHNRASDARFLPVIEALKARGFRAGSRITGPSDVAFSVDGVTTGFGVFADATMTDSVARTLAEMPGVEIVTRMESPSRFVVMSGMPGGAGVPAMQTGVVERRAGPGEEQYRYTPQQGDPLRYAAVVDRMRAAGALDTDGFGTAESWTRYTTGEYYPVAPVRIVRGHTVVTLNPAPILVSVDNAYRVGLGAVSIANRMRPLGGTHGALNAGNSLGVLMTNFTDTHDDITSRVRLQLGEFGDLRALPRVRSGARLTSPSLVRRDRLSPFGFPAALPDTAETPALDVWLSDGDRRWARDRGYFVLQIRALREVNRGIDRSDVIARYEAPVRSAMTGGDSTHFYLPLDRIGLHSLAPFATYSVRIVLGRDPELDDDSLPHARRDIATMLVRTDARGLVSPY